MGKIPKDAHQWSLNISGCPTTSYLKFSELNSDSRYLRNCSRPTGSFKASSMPKPHRFTLCWFGSLLKEDWGFSLTEQWYQAAVKASQIISSLKFYSPFSIPQIIVQVLQAWHFPPYYNLLLGKQAYLFIYLTYLFYYWLRCIWRRVMHAEQCDS